MSTLPSEGFRWKLGALSLAMLLPSLGISIANVALPTLTLAFDASSQDAQWVVIAYLITLTASLVAAGWLGDRLGRRKLLIVGIAGFGLAALGAAVATNLWILVLTRAIQGVGAAIMMSLTMAAVGDAVPKDRIGTAMGWLGTVSAIGTALGPSLGGLLLETFGWSSLFLLLAASTIATLLSVHLLLPPDTQTAKSSGPLDIVGMLLLVVSVGMFAIAATLNPIGYFNVAAAALSGIGMVAFGLVEANAKAPLVQLRLLRDGDASAGLVSIGLVSAVMMSTLVVGPFYLSGALGLGPVATGLVMSVGPTVSALVGLPAGRLVDRAGSSAVILWGLASQLIGTLSMAIAAPVFGLPGYVGSLILVTAGYALFQAANNTAAMNAAMAEHRGVMSALLALSRNVGLIVGASAMGAVFSISARWLHLPWLHSGDATGLQVTFAVAGLLVGIALLIWARRISESRCNGRGPNRRDAPC